MELGKIKFILDSDTFIRAKRTHYPFDFAMPFWNALLRYGKEGIICSIDKVYNEITYGNDELSEWIISFKESIILTETNEILSNYSKLINWVAQNEQYNQNAKDEFYDSERADAWLLATALTYNKTIVTHEVFNQSITKRVPIPNVCKAFNIQYIDIYQMLRDLNFTF